MSQEQVKKPKKKGPIRTEAVVPFVIVVALVWAYFTFLFDSHLRKAIEYVGYQVVGAQVDVRSLETSFLRGTFRMQGLEVTNSQKPERNMIAIGDIRFGVLWDGLLRARIVIDEMAVEQIQIDTPRKSPGRVKPPEPPQEGDGALSKAAQEMKEQALTKTQRQYSNNVLGDIASLLAGTSGQDQLSKIEGTLMSKQRVAELQSFYAEKSKVWDQKIQALPKPKEIQALSDRLGKIKTGNFKTPQELADSVNQFRAIAEEADQKHKLLQQTGQDMSADLKNFEKGIKELEAMVKKDIADLETRFKIPKLDPKSLATGLFRSYLDPYLARMHEYKEMAEKYMPPNLMKKGQPDEADIQIQPRPRANGVSYEFGKPRAYPMFWVRKISVSSKASAALGTGNMAGQITDVTSNQLLVGRPTVATFKGDFPSFDIQGFAFKGTFDNLKAQSKISYETQIALYPINGRPLVRSDDVDIVFDKADGSFTTRGELVGFRDLSFSLQNSLAKVDYQVKAQNQVVDEILKGVFLNLPVITLDVTGQGRLPALDLAINSNLGPELQRGFEREVKKKIEEARAKIEAYIQEQVGKEKAKLEAEYNRLKSQVEGEVKKLQAQLESQKKEAETKVAQAQKDGENKAKQQLQKEGENAVDELKKRFGL